VSAEVRNRLQDRAKDFFILLDDVSIVSAQPMLNPNNKLALPYQTGECSDDFKFFKNSRYGQLMFHD
jgi:hypothetical protein